MVTLVFDTSPLNAFARARELDTLRDLTEGHRCCTTEPVLEEIDAGVRTYPELALIREFSWLQGVRCDGLEELIAFAHIHQRFGRSRRDVGEASVLAWAKVHRAIAIIDERVGRQVAQEERIESAGTLRLIADGIQRQRLTLEKASMLVDRLRGRGGAWLPCDGGGFLSFCRKHGLL